MLDLDAVRVLAERVTGLLDGADWPTLAAFGAGGMTAAAGAYRVARAGWNGARWAGGKAFGVVGTAGTRVLHAVRPPKSELLLAALAALEHPAAKYDELIEVSPAIGTESTVCVLTCPALTVEGDPYSPVTKATYGGTEDLFAVLTGKEAAEFRKAALAVISRLTAEDRAARRALAAEALRGLPAARTSWAKAGCSSYVPTITGAIRKLA